MPGAKGVFGATLATISISPEHLEAAKAGEHISLSDSSWLSILDARLLPAVPAM